MTTDADGKISGKTRRARGEVLAKMKELGARTDGVTSADMRTIGGLFMNEANSALKQAKGRGHLVSGYSQNDRTQHYFTTPELLQAWFERNGGERKRGEKAQKPAKPKLAMKVSAKPAPWEAQPLSARQVAPKRQPVEVIVPADVKRTTGPSYTHDPRYQCAPGEQPPAMFSRLPLGATLYGMLA